MPRAFAVASWTTLPPCVIVVGAMLVAATADTPIAIVLAFVAVILGTINVVGGFVVTDRMLEMFKRRPANQPGDQPRGKGR